jgi:hypothetical protein
MSLQNNMIIRLWCGEVSNLDVDEYRNMISEFSDLPLFDEKCSFYYDETGNVRKFRLTENGVNAEEGIANDFILGGVLFKGDTPPCDVDKLFDGLKINASEIKFRTLAGRGADFWTAIGKKPIQQFLSWLNSSGLYVHYATLNNMYFSVVDIVDSLFAAQPQFNFGLEWTQALKASLQNGCKTGGCLTPTYQCYSLLDSLRRLRRHLPPGGR